jgi:hypothetical protein
MTFLYIDESGDLGMNNHGSKYFIISCVKIDDEETHNAFRRIPKKIRQNTLKKKMRETSELKFSNSSPLIREQFLDRVAKLNIQIFSLTIRKSYTNHSLQKNLPILYNYLIKILLEKVFDKIDHHATLNIFLDRCMSNSQRQNFEDYIKTEFFNLFKKIPTININHENSESNGGLQVIDFIAGSFGYKYNSLSSIDEGDRYIEIFKSKIIMEKTDLFKEKTIPVYLS